MSLVAIVEADYVTVPLDSDDEIEGMTQEQRNRIFGQVGRAHARGRAQVRVREGGADLG
jgi:hypothetical protein